MPASSERQRISKKYVNSVSFCDWKNKARNLISCKRDRNEGKIFFMHYWMNFSALFFRHFLTWLDPWFGNTSFEKKKNSFPLCSDTVAWSISKNMLSISNCEGRFQHGQLSIKQKRIKYFSINCLLRNFFRRKKIVLDSWRMFSGNTLYFCTFLIYKNI